MAEGTIRTGETRNAYGVLIRKLQGEVNEGETNWMQQLVSLLLINCSSTCFGASLRPSSGSQTAFHCLWFSVLL